jgi:hypothetical protein
MESYLYIIAQEPALGKLRQETEEAGPMKEKHW